MNDNDINEMIKKAQDMIKNNQVPKELNDLASQLGNNTVYNNSNYSNPQSNEYINSSNVSNNSYNSPNSGNPNMTNIDMNTILKMQNMLSKLNSSGSDDDMSKLLFALKPYLRNEKKEKINEYINLIKMGKMAQLFDILGGDKH